MGTFRYFVGTQRRYVEQEFSGSTECHDKITECFSYTGKTKFEKTIHEYYISPQTILGQHLLLLRGQSQMALSDIAALIFKLLIFITTVVNFSVFDPLVLLAVYAILKIFSPPPEDSILSLFYQDLNI